MNRFAVSLLLVLCISTGALANLGIGVCPLITGQANFNIQQYLGRWYENLEFDSAFEAGDSCITSDYGAVSTTEFSWKINAVTLDGSPARNVAFARATGAVGQFVVTYPGQHSGPYAVLKTDYTSYASIYSCTQKGEQKEEYAWVLTRSPTVTADVLAKAKAAFKDLNIDITSFQSTVQGTSCQYVPTP